MLKRYILIILVVFQNAFIYADDSNQQFEGFNLAGYTDTGEKSWDVNGDTADVLGAQITLTNVNGNSYEDDKMNVKAKTGTIDRNSGQMHLEKDVVITTERGTQLKTDTLDWFRQEDLVKTEDRVFITDKGMKANGQGATAHPNLKTAQLNKDVTMEINTEPKTLTGEIVTITCDGPMEIDQAKQSAVFNENVVAIQTGRELIADRMEVHFDMTLNKMKKVICLGNVRITQGENVTYSEKAEYDAGLQTMVLTGRPKLIMMMEGGDMDMMGAFGSK